MHFDTDLEDLVLEADAKNGVCEIDITSLLSGFDFEAWACAWK